MATNADGEGQGNSVPPPAVPAVVALPEEPKGVREIWSRGQDPRPSQAQSPNANADKVIGAQICNGDTTVNSGDHRTINKTTYHSTSDTYNNTNNSTNNTDKSHSAKNSYNTNDSNNSTSNSNNSSAHNSNNSTSHSNNTYNSSTNNTFNFDNSPKNESGAVSFQEDLRRIHDVPEPLVPLEAEVVRRYVSVLLERRVLVIMHRPNQRREALSAMRAVIGEARCREAEAKLFTSGYNKTFPLHSFYAIDPWRDEFQNSIVFLDRSADVTAFDFCDSERRKMLRDQLEKMNSRLVLTVGTDVISSALTCPDAGNWFVAGEATVERAVNLPAFEDVFESTVVCCAALLPALPVAEFVSLVDRLEPPGTVAIPPPPPTTPNGETAEVKPPKPTREQRWRSGDRDSVLRELGVTLAIADGDAPDGEEAGLVLSNEEQRMVMPGHLLTSLPILIRQHAESITAYYFSSEASARFRKNYLDLLFRLDALRIMPLTPAWLLQQYNAIDRRESPLEISPKLTQLLVKALDRKQGEALVIETLRKLVDGLIACERKLLDGITEQMFAEALDVAAHAGEYDADPNDVFWAKLIELSESTSNAQDPVRHMLVVLDVLIKAAQHLPAQVAVELMRAFDDAVVSGTQWERLLKQAELRWHGPRLPRLALQSLLTRSIEDSPLEWAAFSRVVVGRLETQTNGSSARSSSSSRESNKAKPAVAKALAIDSLAALVNVLDKIAAEPLKDALHDYLTAIDERVRAGQLLGKLVVQGKVADPVFVESLLRSLVTAFRSRDGSTEEDVSAAVTALAGPIRAAITARERFDVSRQARNVQNAYLARRNHFVAVRNREQAQVERERLAIMTIVIRALSGPLPPSGSLAVIR